MSKDETKFYIQELRGEECACGAWKKSGFAFCFACYHALPFDIRDELWNRMGDGYEEAYDIAIKWLKEDGRIE